MHRPQVASGLGTVPVVGHSKCQPSTKLPTAYWQLECGRHVLHSEDGDDTTASALFVLRISARNLHIERVDGQSVCRTDDILADPGLRAAFVGVAYPTIQPEVSAPYSVTTLEHGTDKLCRNVGYSNYPPTPPNMAEQQRLPSTATETRELARPFFNLGATWG